MGATLGVLWLAALPAAHVHADAQREACLAAHVQGQELKLAGEYAAARAEFASCSAASCPALIRNDCASMLAGLDASLPSIVLAVRTPDGRALPDAHVFVDGTLVSETTDGAELRLAPGTHQLRVEAEGRVPSLSQLEVAPRDRARPVEVTLASAVVAAASTAPRAGSVQREPSLWPVFALGGSGLAVLAAGAAMGAVGKAKENDLEDCKKRSCPIGQDELDDAARGRRLYIAADVAFGVGAALGVAAVTLYFVRHHRRGETAHALLPLDAAVHAGGATLRYRAAF